jgi:hypothetical protein
VAVAAGAWLAGCDGVEVDVATEDDAVAALGLYLEQAQAIEALAATPPERRPGLAARHAERVARALEMARPRLGADAAARAYWGHRGHDDFVAALRRLQPGEELPELPGELYLRLYIRRLPPATTSALRGHPVARPALDRLGEP